MWSFVGKKENKFWVWLALNRDTREIVGVHVGDRSAGSAQKLLDSLPDHYKKFTIFHTDCYEAYSSVIQKNNLIQSKYSGNTNHIERFNCTIRQRLSRFVRKTLSFSKKLENHIGSLWFFIHQHNKELNNALLAAS